MITSRRLSLKNKEEVALLMSVLETHLIMSDVFKGRTGIGSLDVFDKDVTKDLISRLDKLL
jgi:hypothetical protein